MHGIEGRAGLACMAVVLAVSGCSRATTSSSGTGVQVGAQPVSQLQAITSRYPPTEADVHFMTGMIAHHAQAVVMARWAPTHGASDALKRMCERIVVGQSDEIALMRTWLGDQGEKVPPADATHMTMTMNGMEHEMLMPGMLTDEQMKELEAARGEEFDRLFLTYMIQHHLGALTMVDELFASPGAAQDDVVYKFASDVYADQSTEIRVMQGMLDAAQSAGGRGGEPSGFSRY